MSPLSLDRWDTGTSRIRIPFDRSISRHRHRSRIALCSIRGEVDVHQTLRTIHHNVWNAHVRALILTRSEIWMQTNPGSDEIDNCAGVRIHRRAGNVLVPCIVGREGNEAVQTRSHASRYDAASAILATRTARAPGAATPARAVSARTTGLTLRGWCRATTRQYEATKNENNDEGDKLSFQAR